MASNFAGVQPINAVKSFIQSKKRELMFLSLLLHEIQPRDGRR